jgi:hypothetical protein
MSRGLRLVWLAMGLSSFVALIVLFLLPAGWQVERSAVIAAAPEEIYPWLEDLQRWRAWSPWQEGDYPGLDYQYAGPAAGLGAEVRWDSDATGDGELRIVESEPPHRLAFEMRFQRGRITARDTLTLRPLPGGGTELTWSDQGSLGRTLLGRLSLPVIERSMGRDLETGLTRLAAVIEGGPAEPPGNAAGRASGEPTPLSDGEAPPRE